MFKSASHKEIDHILRTMGQRPNPLYFVVPESPEKSAVNAPLYPLTPINSSGALSVRRKKKKLAVDLKNIESIDELTSYFNSATSRVRNNDDSEFCVKRNLLVNTVKKNMIIRKFFTSGDFSGMARDSSQNTYSNLVRTKPLIIRNKKKGIDSAK